MLDFQYTVDFCVRSAELTSIYVDITAERTRGFASFFTLFIFEISIFSLKKFQYQKQKLIEIELCLKFLIISNFHKLVLVFFNEVLNGWLIF